MYIEGTVKGNIDVRSLSVKSSATVAGNIRCRFIEIAPKAVIKGTVNVLTKEEYKKLNPDEQEPEDPPEPEKPKSVLFIVDPQTDFLAGGAYPISGSDEDSNKIADYVVNNIESIDDIYLTLESRHVS